MSNKSKLEVSLDEWERRKAFYGFDQEDAKRLLSLKEKATEFVDEVVSELYKTLEWFKETRSILDRLESIEPLKAAQKRYFLELFDGEYGEEYLRERLKIGRVHHHIGLEMEWYLGAYTHYYQLVHERIMQLYQNNPAEGLAIAESLHKLIVLDQTLASSAYLTAREARIREQGREIERLSSLVFD
jgi:hypothetical protein